MSISRPTSITMPVTKRLSANMRAEAHLLYRMMESSYFEQFTACRDFAFDTPEFQVLYDLLGDVIW